MIGITRKKLEDMTILYSHLKLECDGLTRILHLVLAKNKVRHKCIKGWIPRNEGYIPHYWIEVKCPDGVFIVDYRRRMWLGMKSEHGVFPSDGKFEGNTILLNDRDCYAIAAVNQLYQLLPGGMGYRHGTSGDSDN